MPLWRPRVKDVDEAPPTPVTPCFTVTITYTVGRATSSWWNTYTGPDAKSYAETFQKELFAKLQAAKDGDYIYVFDNVFARRDNIVEVALEEAK